MRKPAKNPRATRLATALLLLSAAGCGLQSGTNGTLRLPETALELRQLQTATLGAPSETDILAASVAVLQDMGFNLDSVEKPLGVLTATKVSDASSSNERIGLFLLDLLCACNASATAQDTQHITLTMVIMPSLGNDNQYVVRLTLQWVVYDMQEKVRERGQIEEAGLYQQFFDNLRKSLAIQVANHEKA